MVLALVAACGSKSSEVPVGAGPAFSMTISYALHGIAPDCAIKRDAGGEIRECKGRHGTVVITMGGENRIRTIDIDLVATSLLQAKTHFGAALEPVIGKDGTAGLNTQLEKMQVGDKASIEAGGAKIDLSAKGTSRILPEYSAYLRW